MTTTYDPNDPVYLDEADVRGELTRVFDVCHGCQRCVERCPTFPTLFDLIGRHDDRDAGRLTPAQQDRVIDQCFHCNLCAVGCPYTPERDPLAVDVPRLVLRATAMRRANTQLGVRRRTAVAVLGGTDRVGRAATRLPTMANWLVGAGPRSTVRRVVKAVTGVSSVRVLPPFTRQRFSTWFAKRQKVRLAHRQASVAVFPTCLVEYQDPTIGHDLVKVYERNGIECHLAPDIGCCGAPLLQGGESGRFAAVAAERVVRLAEAVRAGQDIVVPQPTCGYVLRREYPVYAPGPDADLVAAHTYDAVEYLMRVHRADDTFLDLDFPGEVPSAVTYHVACHVIAQQNGLKGRDLLKLTGARVRLVQQCCGVGGVAGWRADNDLTGVTVGAQLGAQIRPGGDGVVTDVVVGDCHVANTVIAEQTGAPARHPLQVLARAYGIHEEP